ncbi:fibronectin type III domain-containing protein [Candidatus Roizmanbacteria bacterium]|nr:fibronectin type III domain-containing protein [Candidatus Roizmanbacteria bacterium]
MTYSKYFFPQEPKIPIPITIGVVLLLIFFLTRFFGSVSLPSRASKKTLRQLKVVNLSHNQAGVFWQTDEKETGWVNYGQSEGVLDNVALDERDLQDRRNLFHDHLSILKNLQPDSNYFYKIVSNNQLVEAIDGRSFSFKTPPNLAISSNLNPAYGKIIRENGEPLTDALVILFFEQAYPLATLSKTTGEWLIPLNIILNKNTLKVQTVGLEDKLSIEIYSDDKKKTQIITNLSRISPLPQTVIVGKNYNFLSEENILSASSVKKVELNKIEILFPKESTIIPGSKPLIKGTAIPDVEVEVTIDSAKSYSFKTIADKEGVWKVIVTEELPSGLHTLKVTTKDLNGKVVQLTRKFSIAKSGEQVLGEATAEATPTFTPTGIPTVTPMPFPSPTIFPIKSPTISITPPTSGIDIIPVSAASVSLIILGIGVLLAF